MEEKYLIIKRRLKMGDKDVAEMFGYKNAAAFSHSARKQQVIEGVVKLYERILGEII